MVAIIRRANHHWFITCVLQAMVAEASFLCPCGDVIPPVQWLGCIRRVSISIFFTNNRLINVIQYLSIMNIIGYSIYIIYVSICIYAFSGMQSSKNHLQKSPPKQPEQIFGTSWKPWKLAEVGIMKTSILGTQKGTRHLRGLHYIIYLYIVFLRSIIDILPMVPAK